jgi:hypothetical protein
MESIILRYALDPKCWRHYRGFTALWQIVIAAAFPDFGAAAADKCRRATLYS